jgi:glycosyltransferase involved in cell wall biosynthesis
LQLIGFSQQVKDYLKAADILISPTHYDAYGLGVHEALCCGLPSFVTRSAGVAERYPEELNDLLLNDPPNADDLVQRLKSWRANVDDYKARVANFSEQLRQRTWTDMAREIVELINSTH